MQRRAKLLQQICEGAASPQRRRTARRKAPRLSVLGTGFATAQAHHSVLGQPSWPLTGISSIRSCSSQRSHARWCIRSCHAQVATMLSIRDNSAALGQERIRTFAQSAPGRRRSSKWHLAPPRRSQTHRTGCAGTARPACHLGTARRPALQGGSRCVPSGGANAFSCLCCRGGESWCASRSTVRKQGCKACRSCDGQQQQRAVY